MESQWSRRLSWFHHQLWLLHFRGYCIWVRAILRTTWRQNQHLRWFYHSRLDKYKALFCWRKELYPINLAKPLRSLKTIRYTIKLNMKGDRCFRWKDNKTVVIIDDDAPVTFTDSVTSPNKTSSRQGQIPGIILSRSYFWYTFNCA